MLQFIKWMSYVCIGEWLLLTALFAVGVGLMPRNAKGFKDTAFHDFMYKATRTDADSLPISMKSVVLMSHYVRVYLLIVFSSTMFVVCNVTRFNGLYQSHRLMYGSGLYDMIEWYDTVYYYYYYYY